MGNAMVVRRPEASTCPRGERQGVGAEPHRQFCPGTAPSRRIEAERGSRQSHAATPRQRRLKGPATYTRRGGLLCGGQVVRRLREACGPAVGFAALWRTYGHGVARPGPLL